MNCLFGFFPLQLFSYQSIDLSPVGVTLPSPDVPCLRTHFPTHTCMHATRSEHGKWCPCLLHQKAIPPPRLKQFSFSNSLHSFGHCTHAWTPLPPARTSYSCVVTTQPPWRSMGSASSLTRSHTAIAPCRWHYLVWFVWGLNWNIKNTLSRSMLCELNFRFVRELFSQKAIGCRI